LERKYENSQRQRTEDTFQIRLIFPNKEAPTLILPVRKNMTVPTLRSKISNLLESDCLVHLLVGPSCSQDILLEHQGTITDRVLPNTNTPCPYLQQGTRVFIYKHPPSSNRPPSPALVGSSSFEVAQASGGLLPPPSVTPAASGFYDEEYTNGQRAPAASGFYDEEYTYGQRASRHPPYMNRAVPAFELDMAVAFCDSRTNLSGSGKIVLITVPKEDVHEYRTVLDVWRQTPKIRGHDSYWLLPSY
jgi:hypothetical protein